MDFAFPWPVSDGEWLAWSAAVATGLFGLLTLFAPRIALRLLRLQSAPDHPEAVAAARATLSGFHLGMGIACIVLAQPLLYLALGLCWALSAFGRLISILSDRAGTPANWLWFVIELALAAMPFVFALGLVA